MSLGLWQVAVLCVVKRRRSARMFDQIVRLMTWTLRMRLVRRNCGIEVFMRLPLDWVATRVNTVAID